MRRCSAARGDKALRLSATSMRVLPCIYLDADNTTRRPRASMSRVSSAMIQAANVRYLRVGFVPGIKS
jgi:hypothetical protein